MHPPGFREHVDFDPASTPPCLLDRTNGRRLNLTAVEAQLVELYAGESGPQKLTERARATGVSVELGQVTAFFGRLSRAGFISAVKIRPPMPPALAPLLPRDPLPMFRPDLKIVPSPSSPGLVEVIDPKKNRSFTIYDFEASVSRMLDGRRTAEDVIEIAGRLGIPVSFSSLKSFVRQMANYDFLAPKGHAEGDSPAAGSQPARRPWTPDVRELYQSALRLFRQGKPKESLDYLSALLQVDPQNPEALELQARVQGEPDVDLNFHIMHEEPAPASDSEPAFWDVEVAEVEEASDPSAGPLLAPRPRGKRRWLVGGGLALLVVLILPVPTHLSVPCQLEPVTVAAVTAPSDGEIGSRPVAAGAAVKAKDVLATYAIGDREKQLTESRERLAREQAEADRLKRRAKPAAGAKLKRKRDARKRALDAALARQAKVKAAGDKRQLAKANHGVAAAMAAFGALDRKYQALTHEAALAGLQDRIALDQAEVEHAQGRAGASVITAPAAGLFLPAPGAIAHLSKDQPFGRIVQPEVLHLTASAPVSAAKADLAGVSLQLPAGVKGALHGLAWGQAPGTLDATIDGADPLAEPPTGVTLRIPTGLRPLVWRLLQ